MDHKTLQERVFALYDGELSGPERREAEAHLNDCTACRESYERWTATAKALFKKPQPAGSEFFVHQVMDRIRGSEMTAPAPARRRFLPLYWLVPAFGLALMFLAVVPSSPQAMSVDAMLFQDMGARSSWINSSRALSDEDTLQFVMEGS